MELILEKKYFGLKIDELLKTYLDFKDKTLIFFDTETLGLKPKLESEQLTEIAAVAYNWMTGEKISEFHKKIKLNPSSKYRAKKQDEMPPTDFSVKNPQLKLRDIMKMTQYGVKSDEYKQMETEPFVLVKFNKWLESFDNPILIAHNARFDMKHVSVRCKRFSISMKKYDVLDTLQISRLFFIPMLQSLSDIGDVGATDMLKKLKNSSTLGNLSNVLNVNVDNWHSANADVDSLMGVLKNIVQYLENNRYLNIDKYHRKAIKKHRKFM